MSAQATLARRHGLDVLIVTGAAGAALEILLRDAPDAPESPRGLAAALAAGVVATLLARRRFPFGAPAALWIAAAAISFFDGRLVVFPYAVFAAGLAAGFLLGNARDEFRGRVGLLIVVASSLVLMANNPRATGGEFVFVPAVFALSWLAGYAFRERGTQARAAEERALQAEAERDAAALLAVAEERARIAREMHDIVAHAVSMMVLQVGAVRHNLPDSLQDDRKALNDVERAGRRALAEMRRLLGAMRERGDALELEPQPGLANLDALVERVRGAGLPVELRVEGDPRALPRGVDLSAYRIVQEGLTNVVKHAQDATRAEVVVRRDGDTLELEVRNDGGAKANGKPGYGLVGIRERVKLYDGRLETGPAPEGGFVLSASLRVTEGAR